MPIAHNTTSTAAMIQSMFNMTIFLSRERTLCGQLPERAFELFPGFFEAFLERVPLVTPRGLGLGELGPCSGKLGPQLLDVSARLELGLLTRHVGLRHELVKLGPPALELAFQ